MEIRVIADYHALLKDIPRSFMFGLLFVGDRSFCCDEAVVVMNGDVFVSIATIAPYGEMGEGTPTIVACYTAPAFRHQGWGENALIGAVKRIEERGLPLPIHVDIVTEGGRKLIEGLPEEWKRKLHVFDTGLSCPME